MYVVQCTSYNVRRTMYVVQCTSYTVHRTLKYINEFILYILVRIIKATGFKISLMSQLGVAFEYISAIILILPPSMASCYMGYIFMNLGFCIIFASLLMVCYTVNVINVFILLSITNFLSSFILSNIIN